MRTVTPLLALALLATTIASAPTPTHALTEAQFITKVLAQDKLLEEAQIGLDIKQIELDASRESYGNWRADLTATTAYNRRRNKEIHTEKDTNFLTTSPYDRDIKSSPRRVSLNLSKRFFSHRTTLSFGVTRSKATIRTVRFDRNVTSSSRCRSGNPNPTDICDTPQTLLDRQYEGGYRTTAYAQATYPLLKRDSNAAALKTYLRNIHDLNDQRLSFLETKEDFLHDFLEDFLIWLFHHRSRQIHTQLLQSLRALQPDSQTDSPASNRPARAFLASVIAQTENAREDAQIQLQAITDRLAVLLDDPTIPHQTPRFNLNKRVFLLPSTTDPRTYLAQYSRDLQRIQIDMQLNQLEITYQKNRRLPTLDLTLRVDQDYDRTGTATLTYRDDTTDYSALLEFAYPLGGSIATETDLAKRALGIRRLQITYAERLERISGDLQRLTRLLDFDEQRLLDAITAAAQSTRLQRQQYTQNPQNATNLRDLIQALRDERNARLEHLDNLIDYHINTLEYDNLLDRLITE